MPRSKTVRRQKKDTGTRITVTLPPNHYAEVKRLADNKRVSSSWIVRDAVEKYIAADAPLLAAMERNQ